MHVSRYLIRIPPGYDRKTGPDPIVFLHGLGLGLAQYEQVLSHFAAELQDIPFLVIIQPQISQDIFHPRFLKPMLRHEKVACMKGLLEKLGWAGTIDKKMYGVTVLSHSKYVCSPMTYTMWEFIMCLSQWLLLACLDAEILSRDRQSLLFCRPGHILFLGRRCLLQFPLQALYDRR